MATTQISLIRKHTEAIRPPRALWVPFELGRPLGAPNDAEFQKRVLFSALRLLEAPSGPVLEDFTENPPVSKLADTRGAWPPDASYKTPDMNNNRALQNAFKQEVLKLRSGYDLAVKKHHRTTVGVSGMDIETIVDFIKAFLDGIPQNPRKDIPLAFTLNFAVDDLKAYYYEAVAAHAEQTQPSSAILDKWFWQTTAASKVVFKVKQSCLKSDDKMLQLVGKLLLIPVAQSDSPA